MKCTGNATVVNETQNESRRYLEYEIDLFLGNTDIGKYMYIKWRDDFSPVDLRKNKGMNCILSRQGCLNTIHAFLFNRFTQTDF